MYWLFGLILGVCVIIIFVYKRRARNASLLVNYEQRIKQLEINFQEVSQAAVENMEVSTAELTELLDSANLALSELRLEIQKAQKIIYQARIAGENKNSLGEKLEEQSILDTLEQTAEPTTAFANILAKENISEDIFQQEPRYQKISNLLATGVSEQEIAQTLGVGYAEINLVKYLKEKPPVLFNLPLQHFDIAPLSNFKAKHKSFCVFQVLICSSSSLVFSDLENNS